MLQSMKKRPNKNIQQQVRDLSIKYREFSPSCISRFKSFTKSPLVFFTRESAVSVGLSQKVEVWGSGCPCYFHDLLNQTFRRLSLPLLQAIVPPSRYQSCRLARDWKKSIFICSVQDLAYYRRLNLWQNDKQDMGYSNETISFCNIRIHWKHLGLHNY